jgi:hypothetical protein
MRNDIHKALAPAVAQAVANGKPNERFDPIEFYRAHDFGSPTTPEAYEFSTVVEKLRTDAIAKLTEGASND